MSWVGSPTNIQEFKEDVLDSNGRVVVQFGASWCPPCKALHPIMDEIIMDEDLAVDVQYVDCDKLESIARDYEVRSLPTLILFDKGVEVARMLGARPKEEIIKELGL